MKRISFFLCFSLAFTLYTTAQQLTLRKGVVINSIQINDSVPESFSLYLPSDFDTSKNWPIVFVFDVNGESKQALGMFRNAAEEHGYILAASNHVNDSLSTSENILISNRMFNKVFSLLPIHKRRIYTAGFSNGARLASLIPLFINGVEGVISCGANIRSVELLDPKNTFYFIGIVGREDYNYKEMIALEKTLDRMKFPNQLIKFNGEHQWPDHKHLDRAIEILTLSSIAKGNVEKNGTVIENSFRKYQTDIEVLIKTGKLLDADDVLEEAIEVYRPLRSVDSLRERKRLLKKDKLYRSLNRNENAALFKESLIKEDYIYYLEEDVLTYNYNNLGWWNYQMGELKKYMESPNEAQKLMGKRLLGYINALVEDNVDLLEREDQIDMEGLRFLWMLKTITAPKDYAYYLKILSNSAQMEDFGTALFYLEELLKNGYEDKEELYALEHTALLRITPEFNKIVEKYLEKARYDVIEE